MKTWVKIIIVFIGGGTVWALSYVSSIKPDAAMMLASVNAAIVGVVSYCTGFPAPKD